MKLQSHGLTDIGRKRKNNQDTFLCDEKTRLFMVADGMGGHLAGEVASKLAIETVGQAFHSTRHSFEPASYLSQAIQNANAHIYEKSSQNSAYRGMGTTMTCLYFSLDTVYVAHVGDSRAYFICDQMIWQLSQDHSLVSEQRVGGLATPLRNVITRSVGYDPQVEVDLYTKKIALGDTYLLCSDGLYGFVKNSEIAKIISTTSLSAVPKKLVDLANERGGEDNITAVVVRVEQV